MPAKGSWLARPGKPAMASEGSRLGRANGGRLKAVGEEPRTLLSSSCVPAPDRPVAVVITLQGIFEDCCLAYHPRIRLTVLRHALSYMYQDVSGSCNLPAVIFYFRHRQTMVCGNPQAKWVQNGMKLLDTLTKALPKRGRGTRRTFQGSHILGEELSSGTSSLPRSTFRGHPRSSEKNASLPTTATPGL
uniref:C-C motif chemokine 25 n=2 Tax=Molossus molossus TaxID=27622 RepID=A0A7J8I519_MOLMO|nr:C-C motif chemokine ligand 25 [Molossus molossus]